MFAGLALASTIDLDQKNIDGDIIVQDNVTYRILNRENSFVLIGNSDILEYERIIVENLTKIENLKKEKNSTIEVIEQLSGESQNLAKNNIELSETVNNSRNLLQGIQNQKSELDMMIQDSQEKQNNYMNKLTGMFVVSPFAFRISIVIFIILLAFAIFMKAKTHFISGEKEVGKKHVQQKPAEPAIQKKVIENPENSDDPLI
jgi:hypothetical protein